MDASAEEMLALLNLADVYTDGNYSSNDHLSNIAAGYIAFVL